MFEHIDEIFTPRLTLLSKLGGISLPVVTNNEWLYLLSEETRNSILIEGYFVNKKSLQNVFSNHKYQASTDDVEKAINYHQAANTFYNVAYNDYIDGSDSFLSASIIKSINSTLRQGESDTGYRRDSIAITGSNHTPPDYVDIAHLINEYLISNMKKARASYLKNEMSIPVYINQVAKLHCLFESIHPFSDGNGRTGRIFLNCMLISSGLPPVIIKGADSEREKYYSALEEFDTSFNKSLMLKESYHRINKVLKQNDGTDKMVSLITNSLKYSLDTFICNTLENKGYKMSTTSELSKTMNYTADSLRVMINRAQLIAKKAGKSWCSNEKLLIQGGKSIIEDEL